MMKRAQLLRLLFLAITLLLLGSMLLISAFGLWRLRSEAITNGLETAAMHSRGFEDLLTQSLRLTAMITAANLENERPRSDPAHVAETFATVLHHAPFLRSLSLLNEDGRVTASSNLANIGLTVSTAAFLPLALPIILIALKSVAAFPGAPFGTGILKTSIDFVGEPMVALLLGMLCCFFLVPKLNEEVLSGWISDGLKDSAAIIMITSAGGSLGALLAASKIADYLGSSLAVFNLGIFLPFIIAAAVSVEATTP